MEALPIPRCTAGEALLHGLYSADGQTEGNTAQKAGNRFAAATEKRKKKDGKLRNTLWIAGKNEIRALYCKYVLGVNIVDFFFFYYRNSI